MSPLYVYKCPVCKKEFDSLSTFGQTIAKCACGEEAKRQLTAPGGYAILGDNSASVTPKSAKSWRRK